MSLEERPARPESPPDEPAGSEDRDPALDVLDPHGPIPIATPPLVAFHSHGDARPLILVRTWEDELVKHAALARHFGAGQPILSVTAPVDDRGPTTIDDWTAGCLSALTPHLDRIMDGGGALGGWSFGGVIAIELDRRLRALGAEVGPLVLIDSSLPRSHERTRAGSFHETLRRVVRILDLFPAGPQRRSRLWTAARHAPAAWLRWSRRRWRWLRRRLAIRSEPPPAFDRTAMTPRKRAIWTAYLKYEPEPVDRPGVLLVTADSRRSAGSDATLGWARHWSGPLRVHPVAGDHYSMFDDAHVATTATAIGTCLDQNQTDKRPTGPVAGTDVIDLRSHPDRQAQRGSAKT